MEVAPSAEIDPNAAQNVTVPTAEGADDQGTAEEEPRGEPQREATVEQEGVASGTAQAEGTRPLNVTDALSYLDAVKTQFVERPDVYNNFLDIMKDFKSQAIDTPGVIERVSTLFRGHNDLIQGFNTFLPPGYRIECTNNALDTTTTITVTTPTGTTKTSSTENQIIHLHHQQQQLHAPPDPSPAATPPLPLQPPSQMQPAEAPPPVVHVPAASCHPEPPVGQSVSHMPFNASSAVSTLNGMSGNFVAQDRGRQGGATGAHEFHHAIQYVNKIKTRFEEDPETYKLFLEILHLYRKEQNHDDVYYKVEHLFKDAPDLLAEFKNFLPMDGTGPSQFSSDPFHDSAWNEVPDKKATPQTKRKKKPVEREIQPVPHATSSSKAVVSRPKKSKHALVKESAIPASPSYHQYSRPVTPSHPSHGHHHHASHAAPAPQHSDVGPGAHGGGSSPQDEVAFFDRAKKALEPRETYNEFLKFLNLFSREIIDARTLIARAETFLGDGELYAQFKDLMGWDAKRDGENEGPPGSIRNWNATSTEMEERFGKSYRRLPLAETKLACSGRDELCRSVLNDVWVSHPTWASEESGFVAHKKNSYEEALHKSEEERHEFQFYIDIITRTITLFQPIYDRIVELSQEERNGYRLPADFGGSSKSIYHRAIKKVYGRDAQGLEVLQALQDCPAVAIPIVLPRLKQKNEEWRRTQRDWNKVWREVDARNFYKSLDHQGNSFKGNDKKYITNKSLVTEVESAKIELAERATRAKMKAKVYKRSSANAPTSDSVLYGDLEYAPHLEFEFNDIGVLQDALKLIFSFLDRSTMQYSSHERRSVERMLRNFIPLFCMFPATEFDAAFGPPLEPDNTDNEDVGHEDTAGSDDGEDHGSGSKSRGTSGRRSAGGSSHGLGNGGIHPNDLRKKLLKTAQEKAVKARSGSASASRAVSPLGSDDDHARPADLPSVSVSATLKRKKGGRGKGTSDAQRTDNEEWVRLKPVAFDTGKDVPESKVDGMDVDRDEDPVEKLAKHGLVDQKPFYTNTTFYALLRLLQLLYSRLLHCKETARALLAKDEKKSLFKVNPVAEELGLVDAHGPGAVLALATNVPPYIHPASIDGHNGDAPPQGGSNCTAMNGVTDATKLDLRPEAHFYSYLLDACEKLFEGELDQAIFEENMRFLFGTKAYLVFTIDKLIAALIKQVQTAIADSKCQELLTLLARTRSKQGLFTVRELIAYRREVEQYLGQDDHLYRIEWDRREGSNGNVMQMWLLGASDPSFDLRGSPPATSSGRDDGEALGGEKGKTSTGRHREYRMAARWRAYSESYVLAHPTELFDVSRVRRPYLLRTKLDDETDELKTSSGGSEADGEKPKWRRQFNEKGQLAVGIQPRSLKLVYEDGSGWCGWASWQRALPGAGSEATETETGTGTERERGNER